MVSASRSLVVDANIREITDEEVAFYEENGWVKLDRLVSPELADELRRVVVDMPKQDRMEAREEGRRAVPLADVQREDGAERAAPREPSALHR